MCECPECGSYVDTLDVTIMGLGGEVIDSDDDVLSICEAEDLEFHYDGYCDSCFYRP